MTLRRTPAKAPPGILAVLRRTAGVSGDPPTFVLLLAAAIYMRVQRRLRPPAVQYQASLAPHAAMVRWLFNRQVRLTMRDGNRVSCRVHDVGGLVSVYIDGDYDEAAIRWEHVQHVVDVGGHVGAFTLRAAKRAPHARFHIIEPNPNILPYLAANITQNRLDTRCRVVCAAVAAAEGTGVLAATGSSMGARLDKQGTLGGFAVRTARLDTLVTDLGSAAIDVLKLDAEGAEYDVIAQPSGDVLDRTRWILCEYHPHPVLNVHELVRTLKDKGFAVSLRGDEKVGILVARRCER